MSTGAIVQVVAVAMALVLVMRSLRASNRSNATLVRWGAIWIVIIAALALLLSYLT